MVYSASDGVERRTGHVRTSRRSGPPASKARALVLVLPASTPEFGRKRLADRQDPDSWRRCLSDSLRRLPPIDAAVDNASASSFRSTTAKDNPPAPPCL